MTTHHKALIEEAPDLSKREELGRLLLHEIGLARHRQNRDGGPLDLSRLQEAILGWSKPDPEEAADVRIPLYAMLDLWMALHGTSHPEFDRFFEENGYAETWARLLAEVRSRRESDPEEWEYGVRTAMEALSVAVKIVDAQERLLIAYRVGGRPPGPAIDYLTKHRPRLAAWREAEVGKQTP